MRKTKASTLKFVTDQGKSQHRVELEALKRGEALVFTDKEWRIDGARKMVCRVLNMNGRLYLVRRLVRGGFAVERRK